MYINRHPIIAETIGNDSQIISTKAMTISLNIILKASLPLTKLRVNRYKYIFLELNFRPLGVGNKKSKYLRLTADSF